MAEAVRLVVWDLDETFWLGTLTEGGITYRQKCHDIVIELAKRGIVSSICSKNDHEHVKQTLTQHGLWDHFVFPSINWDAKGPRIAALVEAIQLRPATVMFIDDNPMNLNEALHFLPDLQAVDESFIERILNDPRFHGKSDPTKSRLAQYKLLERRKAEETVAVGSSGTNHNFLRTSGIKVQIEYQLDDKINRIVELVNRTNQLNFTKSRLPEDTEAASEAVRRLLSQFDVQAALIKVSDNFGDYGYVGFYAVKSRPPRPRLLQFCFSCRVLNMGIEQWLYRRLGRPKLKVSGDVSADPFDETIPADWVHVVSAADERQSLSTGARSALGGVGIRGGCDLTAIGHYFRGSAKWLVEEYNTVRNGILIRLDHSHIVRYAVDGFDDLWMAEASKLGYIAEDFRTALTDADENSILLLSFTVDVGLATYRHKRLGFRIPFRKPAEIKGPMNLDLTSLPGKALSVLPIGSTASSAINELRANYEYEGPTSEALFKENLRRILARLSLNTKVFILGANDTWHNPATNREVVFRGHTAMNLWICDVLRDFPSVRKIDVRDFVHNEDEVETVQHFSRSLYFRIYQFFENEMRMGSTQLATIG